MSAHTQTPWRIGTVKECDERISIEADATPFIAMVDPCFEQEANAAFIVLACNAHEQLVATLEKLVFKCEVMPARIRGALFDSLEEARAALKGAKP